MLEEQDTILLFEKELQELYGSKRKNEFEEEIEALNKIIAKLKECLNNRYHILKPIGIGGTAVVFLLEDIHTNSFRALKLSRPIQEAHKSVDLIKDEGEKLSSLDHINLIKVYEVNLLNYSNKKKAAYFIMDYVKDRMDLKKKILFEIFRKEINEDDIKEYSPTISSEVALEKLFTYLHGLASGLEFIHINKFIHFDIKPENFLIDDHNIPKVADLGYAKEKTTSGKETRIGFTSPYAHPDLYKFKWQKTEDENRLRASIARGNFKFSWDIYALGQSVLEMLNLFNMIYPDDAIHTPKFRYLHLMACRMLDGKNRGRDADFFNEMALGLSEYTFKEISYNDMTNIRKDLEKEMDLTALDKSIPELDFLSRNTLHGAETRSTTFTLRLKRVVEHQLLSRLYHISQLGMIKYVYPTANHTRYDHSIGTYTNACAYVIALYNDKENPLFKQLMDIKDIEAVLLASLLHDLGQYPLAHDIEEVTPNILRHEFFSIELLKNDRIVDCNNQTLRQIIENEENGWGVQIDKIIEIIGAKPFNPKDNFASSSFKVRLLATIINGPIDADKVDYLMRDSRECRLNYGQVIDFERLMKTITVAHRFNENYRGDDVSLAVYDKGKPCAESVAFARYLLFSAVYWHHTSRACKAMIHQAVRFMMFAYEKDTKRGKKMLNVELKNFAITLDSNLSKKRTKTTLTSDLKNKNYLTSIYDSDLEMLSWLYQRTPEKAKSLLMDLAKRRIYKRLASIHFKTVSSPHQKTLWETIQNASISNDQYVKWCEILQSKILYEARRKRSEDRILVKTRSLSEEKFNDFEKLMGESNISVLIDVPRPQKYKDSIVPLRFIKETMEKRYLDDLPDDFMTQISEVWSTHYEGLMESLAVIRIFCHPDVRYAIKTLLSVAEIIDLVHNALDEVVAE